MTEALVVNVKAIVADVTVVLGMLQTTEVKGTAEEETGGITVETVEIFEETAVDLHIAEVPMIRGLV